MAGDAARTLGKRARLIASAVAALFVAVAVLGPTLARTTGVLVERPVWSDCGLSLCECTVNESTEPVRVAALAEPSDYCGAPSDAETGEGGPTRSPTSAASAPGHEGRGTRLAFERRPSNDRPATRLLLTMSQLVLIDASASAAVTVHADADVELTIDTRVLPPLSEGENVPTPPPRLG